MLVSFNVLIKLLNLNVVKELQNVACTDRPSKHSNIDIIQRNGYVTCQTVCLDVYIIIDL